MINKNDFKEMEEELKEYDSLREEIIKKSRDVLKYSKQVIYAIHRSELDSAQTLIGSMKEDIAKLNILVNKSPALYFEGSYKVAVQEYVEAVLYFEFVKNKRLASSKDLCVKTDYFLLGLCDLTGELVRKAVHDAIENNYTEVLKIRDFIDQLYGTLLHFDFRGGELRKKFDAIKYDLKKVEDILFSLKLKQ